MVDARERLPHNSVSHGASDRRPMSSFDRWLVTVLKWVITIIVIRITWGIFGGYPNYFPPDFARGFLQGRSEYFYSLYQYAFYTHIVVAPAVLILGLPQFSQRLRTKYVRLHLRVGSVYTYLVLGLVVPSGLVMSFYAMGGVASVLAFFAQSLLTFATTTIGWQRIRQGRIREHGVWMIRSYLLISAAVNLRLLAIVSDQLDLAPTVAYTGAAWLSWLVPLVIFEIWIRYGRRML